MSVIAVHVRTDSKHLRAAYG